MGEDGVLDGEDSGSWDTEKNLIFFYVVEGNFFR
jgi:hypothetical protein